MRYCAPQEALAVGTISKALELLNLFSRSAPSIGLTEFVRQSGRDKATVHRHLVELEQNGFLEQDPDSRAYRLGPAILRLSGVREATNPARSVLRPIVTQLSEEVGELVHVSLLQGEVLSPVFHADPLRHGTQVHFDEAELFPLHATSSGLAVLAFSSGPIVARVLAGDLPACTDRTITDPGALRQKLDEVRETGFCTSAQTYDKEVTSQGAPIFGTARDAIGALSVAVPSGRATPEKLASIRAALGDGVVRATRSMGGTVPPEHGWKWQAPDAGRQIAQA